MSQLSFIPTPPNDFGGQLDQLINPLTLDYVRTVDGEWQQTADSRTIMLIAMSVSLGMSPYDPGDGTALAALIRQGELVSPEMVQSEVLRVGQILTREGVLADLLVSVRDSAGRSLVDETGRLVVRMSWRDLASGSPINEAFTPG
jgi:hypothetical protein